MKDSLPERTVLGSYELREVLGRGGGGISYLAYDRALEREVVVKEHFPMGMCYRREGCANVECADKENYARSLALFCREARILAGLNHQNVVKVYDIFEASDTAYMVMEYVEGCMLKEWMPAHVHEPQAVQSMLEKLLCALEYLHGCSVLHRDIKPVNIIIRNDVEPVLLDFGSAHLGTANHTLTPVGSPGYAAPEQFSPSGSVGAWSDLYALAQSFLHLIPQDKRKKYPRKWVKALHKSAQPDVAQRFASAADWLAFIKPKKRNLFWLIIVLGLVGIVYFAGNVEEPRDEELPAEPAIQEEAQQKLFGFADEPRPNIYAGISPENVAILKAQEKLYDEYVNSMHAYKIKADKENYPEEEVRRELHRMSREYMQKVMQLQQ